MGFHPTTDYLPGDAGGVCFFCRSAQRDVVDPDDTRRKEMLFRADEFWDGDVYLCADGHPIDGPDRGIGHVVVCEQCAIELARAVGFTSPADMAQHITDVEAANARAEEAEGRAERAEALVAALRSYDGADLQGADEPAVSLANAIAARDASEAAAADNAADNGSDNPEPETATPQVNNDNPEDTPDAEAGPEDKPKRGRPRTKPAE